MLQRLSRRHTSAVQQAKEGSPFLRGDPQYAGRVGTPGTPFYRENGDPGSPFSRDPQNFMTPEHLSTEAPFLYNVFARIQTEVSVSKPVLGSYSAVITTLARLALACKKQMKLKEKIINSSEHTIQNSSSVNKTWQ